MSRNHDASIKNLETHIGQLSWQIAVLPSSSRGFTNNTIDNPKNETWKVVETNFGVVTKMDKAERVQEDEIKKKDKEFYKMKGKHAKCNTLLLDSGTEPLILSCGPMPPPIFQLHILI